MAQWIKADGTIEIVKPANGKQFSLDELQKFVGGYIEMVPYAKYVYCNEEGRLKGLPQNQIATLMFNMLLVGDVILCSPQEAGVESGESGE